MEPKLARRIGVTPPRANGGWIEYLDHIGAVGAVIRGTGQNWGKDSYYLPFPEGIVASWDSEPDGGWTFR